MNLDHSRNHLNHSDREEVFSSLKADLKEHLDRLNRLGENTQITLERFEGTMAVCENRSTGEMFDIPKSMLPSEAEENSILTIVEGKYLVDVEATKKAKQEAAEIADKLFKKK